MPRYARAEPPTEFIIEEHTEATETPGVFKKSWVAQHRTRKEVHSKPLYRRLKAVQWAWLWKEGALPEQQMEKRRQGQAKEAAAQRAP